MVEATERLYVDLVGQRCASETRGMSDRLRLNALSGPALWLVLGRGVGFLATFVVPLVLVRVFDQATFGTYKQLFLIYGTLYGLAQVGVAESLYYFVPRHPADAGRHAVNAVGTLAVMGVASAALIALAAPHARDMAVGTRSSPRPSGCSARFSR